MKRVVLSALLAISVCLSCWAISQEDTKSLHPLMVIDSANLKSCYAKGRDMFKHKQSLDSYLGPYVRQIGTVRSPSIFHPWTPPKVVFEPPAVVAVMTGYQDARLYDDSSKFDKELEDIANDKPSDRQIHFAAMLFAWPGISTWNNAVNRAANPDDVKDVHFVMLLDGDPEKPVHPTIDPTLVSSNAGSGSYSIPEVDSMSVTTGRRTSYYNFYTEKQANFNYYRAVYQLSFPLYGPDGNPYITKSTKHVVVKVIYPSGEHTADFPLADLPKP